jgi:hypothetical protein
MFVWVARQNEGIPTEALVRVFDATINELSQVETPEDMQRIHLKSYDIQAFLDHLRQREDLAREELARREYMVLPLLGSLAQDVSRLVLHEFMAAEPEFFVSVLCDAFLPSHHETTEKPELSPEMQARARIAYTLLKSMHVIPGHDDELAINEAVLLQWIAAVRALAAEADRATIADLTIGEILAHAPADPNDGGWPHQGIRNVLEQLVADDIERGLMIERFNMRGAYWKALYEGGAQERAFAEQYREWARIARGRWPRVAQVLECIAQDWEAHARREDQRVEQDKLE